MNACRISASRARTPPEHEGIVTQDGDRATDCTDDNDEARLIPDNVNSPYVMVSSSNGRMSHSSVQSMATRSELCNNEEKLRRKLSFFFMDPVRKFIARRQAPWKLMIQFLKIILVTVQLIIFGNYRYAHTNYYADNETGFEHLFLKNWDSVREINSYPPTTGAYALYQKSTFYAYFDYAADNYFHLEERSINPLFKNSTLDFCTESFVPDNLPMDLLPKFDDATEEFKTKFKCLFIPIADLDNFDSSTYLGKNKFDVPWEVLEKMYINFTVRTITYRQMGPLLGPACFTFDVRILFDNSDHDGQITINLDTHPSRVPCTNDLDGVTTSAAVGIRFLDYSIILNCIISFVLCCRALFRAQILCVETREYFQTSRGSDLSRTERFQFLNLWYIVICVNDIFIITGSVLKELIELRQTGGDLWNFCSVFLGSGSLLVWIGMLRYLGFFDTYNVLILTLKGALPNVVRFMICAGMVYLGYTFCGWVVLGPYHFKFKTLESTSECLFSLVNGDDMFATFSMISNKAPMIHAFSRVYLYSFVMLFIYVILSLFIAIIMDTYEAIKEYYKNGFPKSRVDEFYMDGNCDHYSTIFMGKSAPSVLYRVWASAMMALYGQEWRGWQREMEERRRGSRSQISKNFQLLRKLFDSKPYLTLEEEENDQAYPSTSAKTETSSLNVFSLKKLPALIKNH